MGEKNKIALILCDGLPFPSIRGGAIETLLTSIAEQNDIHQELELVIFSQYDSKAIDSNHYRSTKTHYIRIPFIHNFLFRAFRKLKLLRADIPFSYYYNAVYKKCRTEQYDLIVFEGGPTDGKVLRKYTEIAPLCYHLHFHGYPEDNSDEFRYLLAVSDYVKNEWTRHSSAQIAYTVHNGINMAIFQNCTCGVTRSSIGINENDFVVIYVGRIIPEKGVLELLSAIESLDIPELKLLLIGSANFSIRTNTDYEQKVAEKVEHLKNRIVFTGYIQNADLPAYYAMADIQVIPSVWEEAAGLVAIEGMAAGLPSVATHSGGMVEYIDDSNSLIIDKGKDLCGNLADGIRTLYCDPELRYTMAENAKKRAKMFSAENFYRNMASVLEEICMKEHDT